MNILFTGANGFLGKNVIPSISKDYKVYSLDLSNADFLFNISNQILWLLKIVNLMLFFMLQEKHIVFPRPWKKNVFFDINEKELQTFCAAIRKVNYPQYLFL